MKEKTYELHAAMSPHYFYKAVIQKPVFSDDGNKITYEELGTITLKGNEYYPAPKEAVISNCPIRLLEITE